MHGATITRVIQFLDDIGRPAHLTEIAQRTSMTPSQVSGAIHGHRRGSDAGTYPARLRMVRRGMYQSIPETRAPQPIPTIAPNLVNRNVPTNEVWQTIGRTQSGDRIIQSTEGEIARAVAL